MNPGYLSRITFDLTGKERDLVIATALAMNLPVRKGDNGPNVFIVVVPSVDAAYELGRAVGQNQKPLSGVITK